MATDIINGILPSLIPEPHSPLQQFGESNIVGITFSREDGQIIGANDEFLRMVRYSRQDLEARRLNWRDMTLPKPFRPEELLWKVGDVFSQRSSSTNVLIVDDDVQVRSFLATLLEAEGYTVRQAADGVEGQAQCERGDVDLLITDLVMPEQEGLETIHAIRHHWPKLPIIAISGAFGGSYLPLAKKTGAESVIRKPFEPDVILSEVRRLTSFVPATPSPLLA